MSGFLVPVRSIPTPVLPTPASELSFARQRATKGEKEDHPRRLTSPNLQLFVQRELNSDVTDAHQTRCETLVESLDSLCPVDRPYRVEGVSILFVAVLDVLSLRKIIAEW